MHNPSLTILAVLVAACGTKATSDNAGVDYSSDYRSWQRVKSMIIQPGHALEDPFGGMHTYRPIHKR